MKLTENLKKQVDNTATKEEAVGKIILSLKGFLDN